MSQTSVSGLVGVSANSSFVFGLIAALPLGHVGLRDEASSRRRTCANSLPNSFIVEPNTEREQTTWSPALSSPMHEHAGSRPCRSTRRSHASVPSSAASRCSKHGDGRVGRAAVDEASPAVGEAARRRLRVGLHEAAGEEQRLGVLAVLAGLAAPARTASVSRCRPGGQFASSCRLRRSCGVRAARGATVVFVQRVFLADARLVDRARCRRG